MLVTLGYYLGQENTERRYALMSYTPNKSTWLNPNIEYLFDNEIIEYDIKDAGFSIIKYYKLLSPEQIKELTDLEKMQRHYAIGRMQGKDKDFSKALMDKFTEVRAVFLSVNNLTDNNIVSVKKDAIYTIGECSKTKFGKIEFAAKNRYTSYLRFIENKDIEVYYNSGSMDIKGMGDSAINRHRLYMLEFIKSMISNLESRDQSAKRNLKKFIDDYKGMKLEEEFYIEFNNVSRDYNPLFNFQKLVIPFTQIVLKELG
jgi:hypothetical protein